MRPIGTEQGVSFDPWERYEGVSSPMGGFTNGRNKVSSFRHGRGKGWCLFTHGRGGGVFSPFTGARGCHFTSGRGHGSVIRPMGGVMGVSFHPWEAS